MAHQATETSAACSQHAERRKARRTITPEALEYVLTYGRRIRRTARSQHRG